LQVETIDSGFDPVPKKEGRSFLVFNPFGSQAPYPLPPVFSKKQIQEPEAQYSRKCFFIT
jgi:hypothetical protein